ncbi:MAG: hypothetical protein R2942_20215 [Ignavibacteria bacterium]
MSLATVCWLTTLDGKQTLPNPPFPFEGKIEETADKSKAYWASYR